ncbi:inositol polyphosphate-5-phosphatase A isoform X4 [Sitophilus oryzae]|uniref:inositol-polyphosphate 5-phosphatase n=1 Tax=Sitophilus oryzae TaxID=7048 RepID=A0A6J2Y5E9_SITOR|nr:inositol polyphosphate-5-phosphatase A isoform X4 [Sitophilus oryzae]
MDSVPILLVTANVGSIFDDPTDLLKIWIAEFLSKISNMDVKFIAVHCQEVGGKKYEKSMKHVDSFVKTLLNSNELKSFNKVCVFLDEDFSSVQHFTALGSLYFVHETVDASIWNFKESKFVPLAEKQVYSGNIEAVPIKEKAKFPQHFFPELRSFDKEIDAFKDILAEFPLVFAPSYPFEEQVSKANSYMPTRCPAWCDRVLLSHSAKEIIKVDHPVEYGLLGPNTCMGDHKPVYLKLKLAKDAGIVRCCGDSAPPLLRLPSDDKCRCFCRTLVTVPINIIDTSDDYLTEKSIPEVATTNSKYLQPSARVQTTLEPYTPESSASRSPFSEENDSEEPEVQRRTSFCPAQLKNKLENILLSSDGDSNNSSLARRSVIVDESTDRIGDSSNVRSRANSTKTRTLGSNIEYKRFNFIRFKKKSRKKNISCIEAVCAIA